MSFHVISKRGVGMRVCEITVGCWTALSGILTLIFFYHFFVFLLYLLEQFLTLSSKYTPIDFFISILILILKNSYLSLLLKQPELI